MECACGFEAKSPAGLAAHRRSGKCQVAAGGMTGAMEVTLKELARMGRFEKVDEARVQSLRSMAAALDANPFNSQMWRELREALNEVLRTDDNVDDALAAAIAQIGGTPLGDASPS